MSRPVESLIVAIAAALAGRASIPHRPTPAFSWWERDTFCDRGVCLCGEPIVRRGDGRGWVDDQPLRLPGVGSRHERRATGPRGYERR